MAETYRVKIARAGNEFEAEGDKEFVLQLLDRFEKSVLSGTLPKGPTDSSKTQTGVAPLTIIPDKSMSPGEFMRRVGFKKHVDMVLAFGYFLEKFNGAPSFTAADINGCYYDAKMESSNSSQMVIVNIKRGYMMEAKDDSSEGKKRYRLTRSGEQYIDEALSRTETEV
jgi:hypothetical protein